MSTDPSSEKSKKIVFTKTKFSVRLNGTKYGNRCLTFKDMVITPKGYESDSISIPRSLWISRKS